MEALRSISGMRPHSLRGTRGVSFAAALLVTFIVCFVGFIAYVSSQRVEGQKAYFEGVSLSLCPGKLWRVGVPVGIDGELRLSYASDGPVRVYMKTDEARLVDKLTEGTQSFNLPVSRSMKIVEIGLENLQKNQNVSVVKLTCTLKFWS
jgi:hypothetical protein